MTGPAHSEYLKNSVGYVLLDALHDVSTIRPRDPIEYIAKHLYRSVDCELYFYEKAIFAKESQIMVMKIQKERENRMWRIKHLSTQIKILKQLVRQERRLAISHWTSLAKNIMKQAVNLRQKSQKVSPVATEDDEPLTEEMETISSVRRTPSFPSFESPLHYSSGKKSSSEKLSRRSSSTSVEILPRRPTETKPRHPQAKKTPARKGKKGPDEEEIADDLVGPGGVKKKKKVSKDAGKDKTKAKAVGKVKQRTKTEIVDDLHDSRVSLVDSERVRSSTEASTSEGLSSAFSFSSTRSWSEFSSLEESDTSLGCVVKKPPRMRKTRSDEDEAVEEEGDDTKMRRRRAKERSIDRQPDVKKPPRMRKTRSDEDEAVEEEGDDTKMRRRGAKERSVDKRSDDVKKPPRMRKTRSDEDEAVEEEGDDTKMRRRGAKERSVDKRSDYVKKPPRMRKTRSDEDEAVEEEGDDTKMRRRGAKERSIDRQPADRKKTPLVRKAKSDKGEAKEDVDDDDDTKMRRARSEESLEDWQYDDEKEAPGLRKARSGEDEIEDDDLDDDDSKLRPRRSKRRLSEGRYDDEKESGREETTLDEVEAQDDDDDDTKVRRKRSKGRAEYGRHDEEDERALSREKRRRRHRKLGEEEEEEAYDVTSHEAEGRWEERAEDEEADRRRRRRKRRELRSEEEHARRERDDGADEEERARRRKERRERRRERREKEAEERDEAYGALGRPKGSRTIDFGDVKELLAVEEMQDIRARSSSLLSDPGLKVARPPKHGFLSQEDDEFDKVSYSSSQSSGGKHKQRKGKREEETDVDEGMVISKTNVADKVGELPQPGPAAQEAKATRGRPKHHEHRRASARKGSAASVYKCKWTFADPVTLVCHHPLLGEIRPRQVDIVTLRNSLEYIMPKDYTCEALYEPEIYTICSPDHDDEEYEDRLEVWRDDDWME